VYEEEPMAMTAFLSLSDPLADKTEEELDEVVLVE
jgi:hypothetical protein